MYMVDSHCDNLCIETSESRLGRHPTVNYCVEVIIYVKQEIIAQRRLRSKIPSLWTKNSLTTDAKRNLRAFKTSYTYNNQDDEYEMLFVIVKMVLPDTCTGWANINTKLETIRMSHFKNYIPKLWNRQTGFPLMGKHIHKLWGNNSTATPRHHYHSSGTTRRIVGVSGGITKISQNKRWGPWTWISTITSSSQGFGPTKISRMIRSWL